jgi:hypothetical protein
VLAESRVGRTRHLRRAVIPNAEKPMRSQCRKQPG